MENTSDYLMLRLLLICMRYDKKVCYKVLNNSGQNVNKVESGVRLIHIPTRTVVTSTSERSQYLNKKNAISKLNAILNNMEQDLDRKYAKDAWKEHTRIVRGNPIRVYQGPDFKLK